MVVKAAPKAVRGEVVKSMRPVRPEVVKAVRPEVLKAVRLSTIEVRPSGQKRKAAEPLPSTSKRTLVAGKDGQPIPAEVPNETPTPIEGIQSGSKEAPESEHSEVAIDASAPVKAKRSRKRGEDDTEDVYAELFGSDEELEAQANASAEV
jgi:hypothetical protein